MIEGSEVLTTTYNGSIRSMLFRLLAAFTIASVAGCATTIVALWSPERLLLAAGRKVITNPPNDLNTACKISEDGSTFFAFSGLVQDDSAGYDVAALAHCVSRSRSSQDDIRRWQRANYLPVGTYKPT